MLAVIISGIQISDSLHIASAFLAIGYRLLPTLNRLTTALQLFKYGYPAISSLSRIVGINHEEFSDSKLHIDKLQSVALQSVVKMRPDTDQSLFSPLNINLIKGVVYAISGPSGVGKSTLLHIISGMLPADNGAVIYNIESASVSDRRRFFNYIAYLDQSPYVAEARVSQNLLISDSELLSRSEVVHYLNKVGLHNISEAIQLGKDPLLGRGGIHLSGGEKLRFCLVRALLQKKPLLLLDEPTAGLDIEAEIKFIDLLKEVKLDHIVVLISHSNYVLKNVDAVISL